MKRTTKKLGKKAPVTVMRRDDETGLSAYFANRRASSPRALTSPERG